MADWWLDEETIGELISRARDRLGKSQYTLAEALREVSGRSDGVPIAAWSRGGRPVGASLLLIGAFTWPPSCGSRQRNSTERPP